MRRSCRSATPLGHCNGYSDNTGLAVLRADAVRAGRLELPQRLHRLRRLAPATRAATSRSGISSSRSTTSPRRWWARSAAPARRRHEARRRDAHRWCHRRGRRGSPRRGQGQRRRGRLAHARLRCRRQRNRFPRCVPAGRRTRRSRSTPKAPPGSRARTCVEVCAIDYATGNQPNQGCATRSVLIDNSCPTSAGGAAGELARRGPAEAGTHDRRSPRASVSARPRARPFAASSTAPPGPSRGATSACTRRSTPRVRSATWCR